MICSKVFGPSRHFRGGAPSRLDPVEIKRALEGSLKRLCTDYLDLFLLHWPDSADYDEFLGGDPLDRLRAQAHVMGEAVRDGKIRALGLSDAGLASFCDYVDAATDVGAPAPVVVQNRFSLWADPQEMMRAPLPLMAYGVLNHGDLSPDAVAPAIAHVLKQPFAKTCCVSSRNADNLHQLVKAVDLLDFHSETP